jgi:hypothetical protein
VRRGPVHDQHDTLARRGVLARELVEEELHHLGREVRQYEPEDAPRPRVHRRIDPQPLVARVVERAWALTLRRPDAAQYGLEAEAGFVFGPDLDRLFRVPAPECRGRRPQLFLNRACSRSLAARRWRGRGTWSVKPRRRIARQAVVWWTERPVRSSIQAATFGAVHSPPSGGSARRAAASSTAAAASTLAGGPGLASDCWSGTASAPRSL